MGEPKMPVPGQNPEEILLTGKPPKNDFEITKSEKIKEAIETDELLTKKEEELEKVKVEIKGLRNRAEYLLEYLNEEDMIMPGARHFHLQDELAKELEIDIAETKQPAYDLRRNVIERMRKSGKYKRIFHGNGNRLTGEYWVKI